LQDLIPTFSKGEGHPCTVLAILNILLLMSFENGEQINEVDVAVIKMIRVL